MTFEVEAGVEAIVDALEAALPFSEGRTSEDIDMWDNVPPSYVGVHDGFASLVMPRVAIPIGDITELKDADGNVGPRTRVQVRRIINELKAYREETIIENGQVVEEAMQRCAGTKEPFQMVCIASDEEIPVGVVMILQFTPGDERLWYRVKQGLLWRDSFIIMDRLSETDSVKLFRLPDLAKD